MCFIGYSKNPKGYRLTNLSTDKVVTRKDVVKLTFDFSNERMMKGCQSHPSCFMKALKCKTLGASVMYH